MSRSYACAIIFLEVRVIGGVFNIDDKFTEIIVWSCVAAAFPLADLVLHLQETLRTRPPPKFPGPSRRPVEPRASMRLRKPFCHCL